MQYAGFLIRAYPNNGFPSRAVRGGGKNTELEGEMYLRYTETEARVFLTDHAQRRQGGY